MNYVVKITQKITYHEEVIATFETFEEAAIFISTILKACVNAECTISKIEGGESE